VAVSASKIVMAVVDLPFWRADRGDRCRIDALLREVSRHFRLAILVVGDPLTDADWRLLEPRVARCDVRVVPAPGTRPSPLRRILAWGRGRKIHQPTPEPTLDSFYSAAVERAWRRWCHELQPAAVIVHYLRLSYLAAPRQTAGAPLMIIDTLDVMSDRYRAFQAAGERHWLRIAESEERAALTPFDVIVGIQNEDTARFQQMLPGSRVITAGHAVPRVEHPFRDAKDFRLLFVGTGGAPNRRALRQFLDATWPLVTARAPRPVRLVVVGAATAGLEPGQLPHNVEVHAAVPDLTPLYAETDVVLNPVSFGGGLKIKNVEALCHGKPLVTTDVGAQGLRDGAGSAFLVANAPESMAARILELCDNPARRRALADGARTYARTHLTPEAAYGVLRQVLAGACSPTPVT
jgi:glycosyltransferase involved in cell wall biosynthesis